MARPPRPRHITLGGRDAVALTVEEYEQLVASRRQIGGQSARVRVLAQQARRTEKLLEELEELAGSPAACPQPCPAQETGPPDANPDCLRRALADLLRRHRDRPPGTS